MLDAIEDASVSIIQQDYIGTSQKAKVRRCENETLLQDRMNEGIFVAGGTIWYIRMSG